MNTSHKKAKANRVKVKRRVIKKPAAQRRQYVAGGIKRGRSTAKEPVVSYTSRIRAIGNSQGVILNSQVIESSGLRPEADIVVQASEGVIIIMQLKGAGVNTDLSSWDMQFKKAIKHGAKPEGDLFEGMENEFDTKEW